MQSGKTPRLASERPLTAADAQAAATGGKPESFCCFSALIYGLLVLLSSLQDEGSQCMVRRSVLSGSVCVQMVIVKGRLENVN